MNSRSTHSQLLKIKSLSTSPNLFIPSQVRSLWSPKPSNRNYHHQSMHLNMVISRGSCNSQPASYRPTRRLAIIKASTRLKKMSRCSAFTIRREPRILRCWAKSRYRSWPIDWIETSRTQHVSISSWILQSKLGQLLPLTHPPSVSRKCFAKPLTQLHRWCPLIWCRPRRS